MTDIAITNTFTSGTTANASQVNQNFTDVKTFLNTAGVPVLQDGAVSTAAKLASDVVTTAKILDANVTGEKLAATLAGAHTFSGINTFTGSPTHGVQNFVANGTVAAALGRIVSVSYAVGNVDITMPAGLAGMEFTLVNRTGATTHTIKVQTGESLAGIINGTYTLPANTVKQLVCVTNGNWFVG